MSHSWIRCLVFFIWGFSAIVYLTSRWICNPTVKQATLVKAKVIWSFIAQTYCVSMLIVLMCFTFPAPLYNLLVFWRQGWKKGRFRACIFWNSYLLIAGNQFKHILYKPCVTAGTSLISWFGTSCLLWLVYVSKLPRPQVTGMTFPICAWSVLDCCANVICAL